jgi:hypothetical protein
MRTEFELVREHLVAQVVDDLLKLARFGLLLDDIGLDLLDFRALVVLELGHLALDPLDVCRRLLMLALGVFDPGLQLDDGRFELLDFADDLQHREMSASHKRWYYEAKRTYSGGVAVLHGLLEEVESVGLGVQCFLEVDRTLRTLQLLVDLNERISSRCEIALEFAELLDFNEDAIVRSISSSQFGRGVVHVAVVSHASHSDCGIIRAPLRDRLVGCDQDVAVDELEGSGSSLVVTDQVQRELGTVFPRSRDPVLVRDICLQCRNRQEGRLGLDRLGFDKRRHDAVVPDGDVVETPASGDLECGGGRFARGRKLNQTRDRAKDGGPVKAGMRVVRAEIGPGDFPTLVVATLREKETASAIQRIR